MHGLDIIIRKNLDASAREEAHAWIDGDYHRAVAIRDGALDDVDAGTHAALLNRLIREEG